MNTTLQYMNQIQETVDDQIGFSLADSTLNDRLARFYIPVGLVHPKKQSVSMDGMKGGAIPAPVYTFKGQYGGTADDQVMNHLLGAVTIRP